MKKYCSVVIGLCLVLLSGCAANYPYEIQQQQNTTSLEIITKNKFIALFGRDKVTIEVASCYWDYLGTIDISDKQPKTVKIPTTQDFHAILRVNAGSSTGASFFSFRPSDNESYRLVYIRTNKGFMLELYSLSSDGQELKKDRLLMGSEFVPECKEAS